VLHGVVEECGTERGGVESKTRADPRHPERMGDEVLARLSLLTRVALAGEGEGALDLVPIDWFGGVRLVLLDDRAQVAEQRTLVRAQLLGDGVGAGRSRAPDGLADAGVAATLVFELLDGDLAVALYVGCLLFRRNRIASSCLARHAEYARDRARSVLS